jgi:hypothetical protein
MIKNKYISLARPLFPFSDFFLRLLIGDLFLLYNQIEINL